MSTTTLRATAALVALVGTLALGACGDQEQDATDPSPDPDPAVTQQDAAAVEAAVSAEAARASAIRLGQLRHLYPTAGLEVPPDTLLVNVDVDANDDRAGDDGGTDGAVAAGKARVTGGWMLRSAE